MGSKKTDIESHIHRFLEKLMLNMLTLSILAKIDDAFNVVFTKLPLYWAIYS